MLFRDAVIAAQNMVRVSSNFPPHCKILSRSLGIKGVCPGDLVFTVVAENFTRKPRRLLASSIGLAVDADRNMCGYLTEHNSLGERDTQAGDFAEELAAEMVATTLNRHTVSCREQPFRGVLRAPPTGSSARFAADENDG